jgi:hypothetical protein
MLSRRTQIWLGLLDVACVVAVVGLTAVAGVPPVRFPRTLKIVCFMILGFWAVSLLYRVIAQLPPIRFQIKTIMIVVAAVAVELWLARVINEMIPSTNPASLYFFALFWTPALVRSWLTKPPPAKGLTGGRYVAWKLRRLVRRTILRWGSRTRF